MPAANLTREEALARSATIRAVHQYSIELDLTVGGETFGSVTTVRFSAEPGASTFIEFASDDVRSIRLNGVAYEPEAVSDGTRIRLEGLLAENELVVEGFGRYTNSGEGLHRFVDPVDGNVYLYTQFAVADANRVFAAFDQPDLKSRFQFTITAPDHWQVLSNASTPLPVDGLVDGTAVWEFEPSPVIASYVTAVIAGPYSVWRDTAESRSGRHIPLGLFTRASLEQHAEPHVMFEKVREGLAFFESSYGVDFPYDKHDHIFVPEYNWGAMENVGAVTFNERYLFRSKVSAARHERRALVVLHELSHMWFGNLVTMRWWDDLWLNESFATWASTLASASATQYTDAWATFAADEKTGAAEQDQLASTHPIVAQIDDLEDVEVNFDGITYDKGASVLKQLVAWVGLEAFHRGVGSYLRNHAESNATLRDLLIELEAASGRDLSTWASLWLETAGVNSLRSDLETDSRGRITRFGIVQTAPHTHPTLRPHRVAIGFYSLADGTLSRRDRYELDIDGDHTDVPDLVGRHRPDLILLNDDDLTYAKIRLDDDSLGVAIEHFSVLDDALARSVIAGAIWDATRDAELPATEFVRFVLGNVAHEPRSTARAHMLSQLEFTLERYVHPDHSHLVGATAGDALWAMLESAQPGSDQQLQFAKSFTRIATSAAQLDLLTELLEGSRRLDGLEIDTDLRWEILIGLAAYGRASDGDISAILATDDTATGRQFAATARAARPDPGIKQEAWLAVATDETLSNDMARAIAAGWRRARPVTLLEPTIEPYFATVQAVWAERSFAMADVVVESLFPAPVVSDRVAEAAHAWLREHDGPAPLRRIIIEQLDALERALRARSSDVQGPSMSARYTGGL